MRKVRKGLLVLISGLIIVLLAAGTALAQSGSASASATGAAGQAGGTFIEGTVNNMRTVNPWKAIESPEYEVLALNFDLLENFDKSISVNCSPAKRDLFKRVRVDESPAHTMLT